MTIRVGLACDPLEELWPSMDLVAEMVFRHLAARTPVGVEILAEPIRPPWRRLAGRLPGLGRSGLARNADRVLNRSIHYPRHIKALADSGRFDLFHLIDHSYSQLVHAMPPGRSVVTCHDLDTFRCLLDPAAEPRPRWFRSLAARAMSGLSRASAIACVSRATYDAILAHGLAPADRLRVVPNGVSPEFVAGPSPQDERDAEAILGPLDPASPEFLHVGSNIPRKRIDVLLNVFARIKGDVPGARLVKIGGRLAPDQAALADRLGIASAITYFPYLEPDRRGVIAAAYRRAAVVLVPSEAEGFGLPVAEALAGGAAVLASDLPVLREVGGDAAEYRPVADLDAWAEAAIAIAGQREDDAATSQPRKAARQARAARFTWHAHADALVEIYADVLAERPPGRCPQGSQRIARG